MGIKILFMVYWNYLKIHKHQFASCNDDLLQIQETHISKISAFALQYQNLVSAGSFLRFASKCLYLKTHPQNRI